MELEDLRLTVYRAFESTGRAPTPNELAVELVTGEGTIRDGLEDLAVQRHLVLSDEGRVLMAHPFSGIPLGFSVMGSSTLWWGGCSWDSFALGHLLPSERDVVVATRCPGCGRAGAWVVGREQPPDDDWIAHFLVPVTRMWDDVVYTCANQRLFCAPPCLDQWLRRTRHDRGYVMDLDTLWRLASRWYEGRLDRGYVRREPAAAADYFRSVGLVDSFWGT